MVGHNSLTLDFEFFFKSFCWRHRLKFGWSRSCQDEFENSIRYVETSKLTVYSELILYYLLV